jgi:hypothetical protein
MKTKPETVMAAQMAKYKSEPWSVMAMSAVRPLTVLATVHVSDASFYTFKDGHTVNVDSVVSSLEQRHVCDCIRHDCSKPVLCL